MRKGLCKRHVTQVSHEFKTGSQLRYGAAMAGGPRSACAAWPAVIALMATSSYSTSDTLKSS